MKFFSHTVWHWVLNNYCVEFDWRLILKPWSSTLESWVLTSSPGVSPWSLGGSAEHLGVVFSVMITQPGARDGTIWVLEAHLESWRLSLDLLGSAWAAEADSWDMETHPAWMRTSPVWMRFNQVVRASGCQCQSRTSPRFNPRILRHSGIWGATDEEVLNKKKSPLNYNAKTYK